MDFEEGIYRYRFQGTVFAERIPLPTAMTSSDAGVSVHYNLPHNYGDVHVGVYDGENYQRVETNNEKAIELRGTLRPFAAKTPVLRGLRVHFVGYTDHYVAEGTRSRVLGSLTYEHKYVNAGFDYLDAKDRVLPTAPTIAGNGFSFWATPRKEFPDGSSWEALVRFDHWTPDSTHTPAPAATAPIPGVTMLNDQHQDRTIAGVGYWFPHQGPVSTAILVDYDAQHFDNLTTVAAKSLSIHGLLQF